MKNALLLVSMVAGCGPLSRPHNSRTPDPADPPNIDATPLGEDCPPEAKIVYVVDSSDYLFSFVPTALTFNQIGHLKCPVQLGATPFSMSVDRHAVAWVLYSSGELMKVSTKTAACEKTNYVPNQAGLRVFGMGFSSNVAGSEEETLFIAGGDTVVTTSSTLAKLSTSALTVAPVQVINGSPELTGTGDARLWGFFPDETAPWVAEISKASGGFSHQTKLTELAGTPLAWAFAFWGGDFWIFLQRDINTSSVVYQFDPDTGQLTPVVPRSGRTIVGAGVSTCAPLTIL